MRISDWSSDVCSSDLRGWTCSWRFLAVARSRQTTRTASSWFIPTCAIEREVAGESLDDKLVIALFAALEPIGGTERKPDAAIAKAAPDFSPHRSPQPLPRDRKSTRLHSSPKCATTLPSYA